MEYVNHFNSPWFQAYADIGNLTYAGHDVVSELEAAKGQIAALHVKDTKRGQLRFVAPGEGDVPFVEAFCKLAEIGFHGSMVLELWTGEHPDAVEIVTAGNTWIRERMKEGWQAHYQQVE